MYEIIFVAMEIKTVPSNEKSFKLRTGRANDTVINRNPNQNPLLLTIAILVNHFSFFLLSAES